MKRTLLFPLLLLAASATALAGTPIDQTRTVAADAHVEISNVKGAVHVTAWDRNQVHVAGTLGKGSKGLEIKQDGNTLTIKVQAPERSGWFHWNSDNKMQPSTLNVQVPRGASLAVDVVSASTDIQGLAGGALDVNSVSGTVRIHARSPKVSVNTVSSNVNLSGRMQGIDIQTVSGDIIAPDVGTAADLETVSGQIHVRGGPYAKVNMSTVSGDIELAGGLQADGSIKIDSVSGDVSLRLPATLSAHLKASTFSGSMHTAFGTVIKKQHGPGESIDSRIGNGNGRIAVQTFSGDVRVGKGN
jgi:DUF4097 and DUF4098 domain-containing protein YvlB